MCIRDRGSILPKLFGGFSTSLRLYDFDLSASFDYQLGGKIADNHYASLMGPNESGASAGSNIHKDYLKAWSPNNTSSDIPRWQYGDRYSVFGNSDRFLTNASYLNFQSFTVGYTAVSYTHLSLLKSVLIMVGPKVILYMISIFVNMPVLIRRQDLHYIINTTT